MLLVGRDARVGGDADPSAWFHHRNRSPRSLQCRSLCVMAAQLWTSRSESSPFRLPATPGLEPPGEATQPGRRPLPVAARRSSAPTAAAAGSLGLGRSWRRRRLPALRRLPIHALQPVRDPLPPSLDWWRAIAWWRRRRRHPPLSDAADGAMDGASKRTRRLHCSIWFRSGSPLDWPGVVGPRFLIC